MLFCLRRFPPKGDMGAGRNLCSWIVLAAGTTTMAGLVPQTCASAWCNSSANAEQPPPPPFSILRKDKVFGFFRSTTTSFQRDVRECLEDYWKENPYRVFKFLRNHLARVCLQETNLYGGQPQFSTTALSWAKEKQVFTRETITQAMKETPRPSLFRHAVFLQLETLFPGFSYPTAMYETLDEKSSGISHFGDTASDPVVFDYYLNMLSKDPRPKERVANLVAFLVEYHQHCPQVCDAFLAKNKDVLKAYVARGISDGNHLPHQTNVQYHVKVAERFLHSSGGRIQEKDETTTERDAIKRAVAAAWQDNLDIRSFFEGEEWVDSAGNPRIP